LVNEKPGEGCGAIFIDGGIGSPHLKKTELKFEP
jgi:hypothetical protein